jgi:hypothetical protein
MYRMHGATVSEERPIVNGPTDTMPAFAGGDNRWGRVIATARGLCKGGGKLHVSEA